MQKYFWIKLVEQAKNPPSQILGTCPHLALALKSCECAFNFLTELLSIIFIMFLSDVGNKHTNKIIPHYLQLAIHFLNKLPT